MTTHRMSCTWFFSSIFFPFCFKSITNKCCCDIFKSKLSLELFDSLVWTCAPNCVHQSIITDITILVVLFWWTESRDVLITLSKGCYGKCFGLYYYIKHNICWDFSLELQLLDIILIFNFRIISFFLSLKFSRLYSWQKRNNLFSCWWSTWEYFLLMHSFVRQVQHLDRFQ